MQPAAVASSRVTAAAREPGFGGHVGVRSGTLVLFSGPTAGYMRA